MTNPMTPSRPDERFFWTSTPSLGLAQPRRSCLSRRSRQTLHSHPELIAADIPANIAPSLLNGKDTQLFIFLEYPDPDNNTKVSNLPACALSFTARTRMICRSSRPFSALETDSVSTLSRVFRRSAPPPGALGASLDHLSWSLPLLSRRGAGRGNSPPLPTPSTTRTHVFHSVTERRTQFA
jgi:hypothetical protein